MNQLPDSGGRSPSPTRELRRFAAVMASLVATAAASLAHGQDGFVTPPQRLAGPWTEPGIELPEGTQSARVMRGDEFILQGPGRGAARVGSALRDAKLPVFAAVRGAGCRGAWLRVGPRAWICSDNMQLSTAPPVPTALKTYVESPDGLPHAYYFVGPNGTFGYKDARLVDVGTPAMQLEPGFAVAIVEARSIDGETYGRTGNDLWVPMRDLGPVHPSSFKGSDVPDGAKVGAPASFAWVNAATTPIYAGPTTARPTGQSIARMVRVDIVEDDPKGQLVRIGEGQWLATKDLRRPTFAPPPTEIDVAAGERWIDVDLDTQTLVAWQGDKPVFATLISSGKGKQGSYNQTPKGVHRIWVKLLSSNMDNLEDENANRWYRMENVPYVQYFSKGVGLHGAFWHRSFGNVRSHGCVNLTPLDAQRLFWFTEPRLPAGWTAVLPSPGQAGTLVRVR